MSFFSTPRKSPWKHVSTHTPPQPVGRVNLKWKNIHVDYLLDILRDLLEEGIRPPYGTRIIPRIIQSLNNQLNDGHYMALKAGNHGTGFGWDNDLGTIDATPEQWEHIKTVYPKPLLITFFYCYVLCHLERLC